MYKNDTKDTNFENASKDDALNLLASLQSFDVVEEVEESDYQLREQIEAKMLAARQAREVVMATAAESSLEDDFKQAKQNLRGLAERQQEVLDDLIALAKASDSPRAFEVVATMLKTFSDLEMSILDLHNKKVDIAKKSGVSNPAQSADTINNTQNVFVGSTKELNEYLKKQRLDLDEAP